MKKTFKNYEIENILSVLNSPDSLLHTSDPNKKLSVKILWKLSNNFDEFRKVYEKINQMREEINQEYISDEKSEEVIDEETGQMLRKVKDEYFKEYTQKIKELMDIDNELEISGLPLDDIENLAMTPADFNSIKFMIMEEN